MADWVDLLITEQRLAPRSIEQYAASLRYWDIWHQLRYGSALPLADNPPSAIPPDVWKAFVEDHLAISVEGRLQMRMAAPIFDGLREAGYNARISCVAPRTIDWRLQILRKAHRLMRLSFDRELVRRLLQEIYAVWEAERAALGVPMTVPMSASSTVDALLIACSDDREGTMDVALVVLLSRLTSRQIAGLRFREVTPGTTVRDGVEVDAVAWKIRDPVSDMQRFSPHLFIVGEEATLIKMWGAIREDEVVEGSDDWFFVRKARGKNSTQLNHAWISRRIRSLAQTAGLADADGQTRVTPQGLRKAYEREWLEQSSIVKVARAMRTSTRSSMRLAHSVRERQTSTEG